MPHDANACARRMPVNELLVGLVFGLFALLAGCGTDLNARAANTLYACAVPADCVEGYSCVCGFCQAQGSQIQVCGESDSGQTQDGQGADGDATVSEDGSVADGSGTDTQVADTQVTDTQVVDVADTSTGGCSPRTWAGCPAGEGCFADDKNKTYCLKTANGTKGTVCDPSSNVPPCGKDAGTPLFCDPVEKKCMALCKTSSVKCENGWTCYPIGNPAWPDETGVCAP